MRDQASTEKKKISFFAFDAFGNTNSEPASRVFFVFPYSSINDDVVSSKVDIVNMLWSTCWCLYVISNVKLHQVVCVGVYCDCHKYRIVEVKVTSITD